MRFSAMLLVVSLLASRAVAQGPEEGGQPGPGSAGGSGPYEGVEPGGTEPPPAYDRIVRRERRHHGPVRILTWPGFTPLPNGGSRFFVQATEAMSPEVRQEQGRIVLLFPGATTHVRNSRRWLETRFFNTPVLRARLERRRHATALVLYLRPGVTVTPEIRTQAAPNGTFHYVYADFPSGHWVQSAQPQPEAAPAEPEAAPEEPAEPPPAPPRDVDDSLDNERPPPVRP